jgi:hypothetical protein
VINVFKGGKKISTLYPERRFYASRHASTIVANRFTPQQDLYLVHKNKIWVQGARSPGLGHVNASTGGIFCHDGGSERRNRRILPISVVRSTPNLAAATFGPPITQLVSRMHHSRPADLIVGRVTISLQNAFELPQEPLRVIASTT